MTMENGPGRGATVLLVEDDDGVRRSLQLLLHWRGYDVRAYPAASPLLHGDGAGGDILIADYRLPDATGCDLRRALGERGWTGRSVLITGYAEQAATRLDCLAPGMRLMTKPFTLELLAETVTDALAAPVD